MERVREGISVLNQITPQSLVESLHNLSPVTSEQFTLAYWMVFSVGLLSYVICNCLPDRDEMEDFLKLPGRRDYKIDKSSEN